MKKIVYISIALTALMAVSCLKEKDIHPVGSRIVFSAATGYMNGGEPTRTIYSGDYENDPESQSYNISNPTYERIDWLTTDKIDIYYNHDGSVSSSRYGISSITSASSGDRENTARIAVENNYSPLEWQGGATHVFYGFYPAGAGTFDTSNPGKITGLEIPYRQTVKKCNDPGANLGKYLPEMGNAYMVAYADKSSDPESTVSLPFTPVMTAIQFRLHLPDQRPSYQVSKVRVNSSTALSGTYDVNISGFNSSTGAVNWSVVPNSIVPHTGTGEDDSIIVEFKDGSTTDHPDIPDLATAVGNQTPDQDYLDFTVFVLPQKISSLDLLIKYTDGSSTIKKVNLGSLSLSEGKKYIITNGQAGYDVYEYSVTPNGTYPPDGNSVPGHTAYTWRDIPVTSIKTSQAASSAGSSYSEPVDWKVQYTLDNGSTWTDGVPSGYSLSENHNNNTFSISLTGANSPSNTTYDNDVYLDEAATEMLQQRTPKTDLTNSSDVYDLSTHALNGTPINQTSANCYVVTAPGRYKFPLVYGNARVNGVDNPSAYDPSSISGLSVTSGGTDAEQNYFLPTFYNAVGKPITDPDILDDLGSYGTVSGTAASVDSDMDQNIITDCSVSGSYIYFTVTKANIKPGNVRIKLEGNVGSLVTSSSTYRVLWSWHIWITDKTLAPETGSDIMRYNLGWVDARIKVNNAVERYTDRSVTLRIVQYKTENNQQIVLNEGTSFTLTQNGDVASIDNPSDGNPTKGKNPHYQWGRKDPYDYNKSTIQLTQLSNTSTDYWRGIRNPEMMLRSEKSTTWMAGKAVPLYKQDGYIWTIWDGTQPNKPDKAHLGPVSTYYKNQLTNTSFFPSGTTMTWVERMSTSELLYWKSKLNAQGNYQSIPAADIVTLANLLTSADQSNPITASYWEADDPNAPGGNYHFLTNKKFSITQKSYLDAIDNVAYNFSVLGLNCVKAFRNNNLEAHYSTPTGTGQWDLQLNGNRFPYGPHYQETVDILQASGLYPTPVAEMDYVANIVYTTNQERKKGSILYNLWSAALYNENATVTKYKTVYDPCPAGFTVPTLSTYLGSSSLTHYSNANPPTIAATVSGFTDYPRTGCRLNGAAGSITLNMVSNGDPCGFYWTDHPCNLEWRGSGYPDKTSIDSYLWQQDAYMLHTMSTSCSIVSFTRATAASIRPMVDPNPNVSSIAGNATPSSVTSPGSNPIESVTFGSEL